MPLFYTGKGDTGKSEIGKKKFPKDSPIITTLGDFDELNSLLGVIRSRAKKELNRKLFLVQETLFIAQAQIAWHMFKKHTPPKLTKAKVQALEKEIEAMEKKIKPERGFVISGENEAAALLDYARAVSRRAERSAVKLSKKSRLSPELLTYMNRLSSYLYALARMEIAQSNTKEKKPTYQ